MLARLLGPHVFGTFAVAYVALLAMQTFNELGVSLAIVRWEGNPDSIVPTVTTISVIVSALIYVICFFSAPVYVSAMGAPAATNVVRVLAVAILIDGLANAPSGLLQRTFRQRQQVIAQQVGGWLGTGTTVGLAWLGLGAMSLALGQVAGALVCVILLVTFAPESLRFGFDPMRARSLLRFGVPLAGSNLVAFSVASADQIVVGHMLGPVTLGYYVLALNLANWPINVFSQPVASVVPAVLSRLQHDRITMRRTFISVAGLLGAVALPSCLLIGGSAKPLINLIYGVKWMPAAEPLIWLALLGAMRILFLLAYDYLVVLAKSRFLLIVQVLWLLVLIPALTVGTHAAGLVGAALAEAAVAAFTVLPCYVNGLRKAGIQVRALSSCLWLPAAGAAITWVMSTEAAKVAPTSFTALAFSGVTTVVVIAFLAYRMRGVLALLRRTSAGPISSGTTAPVPELPRAERDHKSELAVLRGLVDRLPAPEHHPPAMTPARHDTLPAAFYHDLTETLDLPRTISVYRNTVWRRAMTRQDLSATSPLYQLTASSLQWDPAKAPHP